MADIAASGVTYTEQPGSLQNSASQNVRVFSLAFGDGSDTYPSGGIPLTKGSVGCPTTIHSASLSDAANANGFVYKYDATNEKLRIYQGDNNNASDAPLIELGNVAVVATTLLMEFRGY